MESRHDSQVSICAGRGSTRKQINKWVSKATNKLITSILPKRSVDPSTVLVLANAIYFKGKWSKPFEKKKTKDGEFYCLDGSRVRSRSCAAPGKNS